MVGRGALVLVALCAAASFVVSGAVGARTTSAPLPPLSSVVLAPADFHSGGAIAKQATTSIAGRKLFVRVFKPGVTVTRTPLLSAVSVALLEPDAPTAVSDYLQLDDAAKTRAGRQQLAKQWAIAFINGAKSGKQQLKVKSSTVGAPVELGDGALRLPLTLETNHGSLRVSVAFAQTDRILAINELASRLNATVPGAEAVHALASVQHHLTDAFTVANTVAPSVAGTASQGQSLHADAGSWKGAPSSFTYAWSRCDAGGAACIAIAGATGDTYTVGSADAGFTLRANVTGANSVGSAAANSAATDAVT
jgi:hypothetical protein